MDTTWSSDFRLIPADALIALGLWLTVTGIAMEAAGLRAPLATAGKNLKTILGMRRMLLGFSLVAVGVGWLLQWPVMVAAGLVVGLEETIETSIAAWALKQEAEGREGFS